MRLDSGFEGEERYNLRTPLFEGGRPQYPIKSYSGSEINFDVLLDCMEEVSRFDGLARACPEGPAN